MVPAFSPKLEGSNSVQRTGKIGAGPFSTQNKPWPPSCEPRVYIPLEKGPELEASLVSLWLGHDLCSTILRPCHCLFQGTEDTFPAPLPGPQKTKIWGQTHQFINISAVTPHLPPVPLRTRNPYTGRVCLIPSQQRYRPPLHDLGDARLAAMTADQAALEEEKSHGKCSRNGSTLTFMKQCPRENRAESTQLKPPGTSSQGLQSCTLTFHSPQYPQEAELWTWNLRSG